MSFPTPTLHTLRPSKIWPSIIASYRSHRFPGGNEDHPRVAPLLTARILQQCLPGRFVEGRHGAAQGDFEVVEFQVLPDLHRVTRNECD